MMKRLARWLAALVLACSSTMGFAAPIEPPQPGAWLVFLCQASDAPREPQTLAHYRELFDPANPDLVHAYFRAMSFGKADISRTAVLGWFRMQVTTAELDPAVRNSATQPGRAQTAEDCKAAGVQSLAASGSTIDPNRWAGFIAVINVNVDVGAVGKSVVANALEPASFYQHEMLHVMGVGHTYNLPNNRSDDHLWGSPLVFAYDDPWDVMSYDVGIFSYDSAGHGKTGPALNMAYRSSLGWLPTNRITTHRVVRDADRRAVRVALAPVSEPQRPGALMAVVSLPNGVRYAVEYRKQSGFDRGVPRGEVVVREWRVDQVTYLVRQQNGHVGYYPGETPFTDTGNGLKITVQSIAVDGSSAIVTIDTRTARAQCLAACVAERNQCMGNVAGPGSPSVRQCVQTYQRCIAAC